MVVVVVVVLVEVDDVLEVVEVVVVVGAVVVVVLIAHHAGSQPRLPLSLLQPAASTIKALIAISFVRFCIVCFPIAVLVFLFGQPIKELPDKVGLISRISIVLHRAAA